MRPKEQVLRAISRLPDGVSVSEIARQIEFFVGIEQALAEVERGDTYTVDEVRECLKEWVRQ